jgi:hypothetical protein
MTMPDNLQLEAQATDAARSPVERLSEETIRRELLSDTLQHPTIILPTALCLMSLIYAALYAPLLKGGASATILGFCSGIVAAGSFSWRYVARYRREYERRVQHAIDMQDRERRERESAEAEELRGTLQAGFLRIDSIEGLKVLHGLAREYEQLQPVLERSQEANPLALSYMGTLAEQTYRQGLYALADAFELVQALHFSDEEALASETDTLEREIASLSRDEAQAARVAMKRETLTSRRDRLDLIEQQALRRDKLLHQADRCEASLARTRIELAALKADSSAASVSTLTEALQTTIAQAREVQEEMRKLGF